MGGIFYFIQKDQQPGVPGGNDYFYGLLFMIPASFLLDFRLNGAPLLKPVNLLNILYLGAGASALCFVTWNFSVKKLGAVNTSIYIYLVPVMTVVTSVLILHEQIGIMSALGVLLTLAGLGLSEINGKEKVLIKQRKTCFVQNQYKAGFF